MVFAMKSLTRFYFGVAATAMIASAAAAPQEQVPSAQLSISLSQEHYEVGEAVVITYRITNTSKIPLCLPPPAFDCYSISGELAATATPPKGVAMPNTNGGCAADRRIDRDAGYDVDHHWIKLPPLQSYETTRESHVVGLIAPGKWTVGAGYVSMRSDTLSIYHDALKERGCEVVPELQSEKASIVVGDRPR